MAKSADKFKIVHRGESLTYYTPGEWFFFKDSEKAAAGTGSAGQAILFLSFRCLSSFRFTRISFSLTA